ncbi:MAG TPA: type IV secretory system conjugative DNA transfer family protein [Bryobacteraceae bacterium]|jgi:type IV secretion system protein VirD4
MSDVQFILDEASQLGPMPAVDSAVGVGRGYGVRLIFIFQSLGQLRRCFPDGQDQTLLSNVTQIYFATNDNATAEYVSTRLGEETIVLRSGGTSRGTSWQSNDGSSPGRSRGGSFGENDNWQLHARRLMKPEEVLALPQRTAITLVPGQPPIRTRLLRHYEDRAALALAARGRRPRGSVIALLRTTFWFATLLTGAALLTEKFFETNPKSSALPANSLWEAR